MTFDYAALSRDDPDGSSTARNERSRPDRTALDYRVLCWVSYGGAVEREEEEGRSRQTSPEPPWRRPQPPPRAPITREAIVEAALVVLDRVGMDGLSMRRVAEELGTGAASLYWHVRNKEELFQLIFDRVTREIVLPEPDPARWKEQLKAARPRRCARS